MNIIFMFFYLFIVIIIIANVLKVVKVFKENNNMFNNINDLVNERYDRVMQNNIFEANKTNNVEKEVDIDTFMKSNSNPIKEVRGKRRKI